jgi:glycosyltransferase involved in cell wall biosynthesis
MVTVRDAIWTSTVKANGVNGHDGHDAARTKTGSVSVVLPTRNEALNVDWVLDHMPTDLHEIIVVDGNSTDGTVDTVRWHTERLSGLRVVHQRGAGKGDALRCGFEAATGDYIVMLDADCSMDPREIPSFVAMLECGFDLVKGSRFMLGAVSHDITPLRKLGNDGLRMLTNRLYHTRLSDLCYGFCAFRRDSLGRMGLRSDGFEIETEITVRALRAGLRICEVPSIERPRRHGVSNLRTFRDGARVLGTLVGDRITAPLPRKRGGIAPEAAELTLASAIA